jgi:hypothetical protein
MSAAAPPSAACPRSRARPHRCPPCARPGQPLPRRSPARSALGPCQVSNDGCRAGSSGQQRVARRPGQQPSRPPEAGQAPGPFGFEPLLPRSPSAKPHMTRDRQYRRSLWFPAQAGPHPVHVTPVPGGHERSVGESRLRSSHEVQQVEPEQVKRWHARGQGFKSPRLHHHIAAGQWPTSALSQGPDPLGAARSQQAHAGLGPVQLTLVAYTRVWVRCLSRSYGVWPPRPPWGRW